MFALFSDVRAPPDSASPFTLNAGAKVICMDIKDGLMVVVTTDRAVKTYDVTDMNM